MPLLRSRSGRAFPAAAPTPAEHSHREPFSAGPFRQKPALSPSTTPGRKGRHCLENQPPENLNISKGSALEPASPALVKSASKKTQGNLHFGGNSALPPKPPSAKASPVQNGPTPASGLDSGIRRKLNWETQAGGASECVPTHAPQAVSLPAAPVMDFSVHDTGVKVVVRVRPLNPREQQEEEMEAVNISSQTVSFANQTFTFDAVAGPDASQQAVFEMVGRPMVENCVAGFNSSIFAYGQTGSGKTYTMWGTTQDPSAGLPPSEDRGIAPRLFEQLFARIQQEEVKHAGDQLRYQCRCSFLEIYNEQITDLLEPSQKNLQIREDVKTGLYVENLTEEYVAGVNDIIQLLLKGLANRRVGSTLMNNESSRSHSVFTCVIESRFKSMAQGVSSIRSSRMNLVDLAGSERQKQTGAAGERLKEAGNINRSLSQLGNVINILAEVAQSGKQRHIPYRDSRLTFLLQESLGGNAKLAMICAISTASSETLSTLRFAKRAKAIQNKAIVNEETENDVNLLREQIRQLKDELMRMKSNDSHQSPVAGYSSGWNARRSYNLLRMSLSNPTVFPKGEVDQSDSDEEMEIDDVTIQGDHTDSGVQSTDEEDVTGKSTSSNSSDDLTLNVGSELSLATTKIDQQSQGSGVAEGQDARLGSPVDDLYDVLMEDATVEGCHIRLSMEGKDDEGLTRRSLSNNDEMTVPSSECSTCDSVSQDVQVLSNDVPSDRLPEAAGSEVVQAAEIVDQTCLPRAVDDIPLRKSNSAIDASSTEVEGSTGESADSVIVGEVATLTSEDDCPEVEASCVMASFSNSPHDTAGLKEFLSNEVASDRLSEASGSGMVQPAEIVDVTCHPRSVDDTPLRKSNSETDASSTEGEGSTDESADSITVGEEATLTSEDGCQEVEASCTVESFSNSPLDTAELKHLILIGEKDDCLNDVGTIGGALEAAPSIEVTDDEEQTSRSAHCNSNNEMEFSSGSPCSLIVRGSENNDEAPVNEESADLTLGTVRSSGIQCGGLACHSLSVDETLRMKLESAVDAPSIMVQDLPTQNLQEEVLVDQMGPGCGQLDDCISHVMEVTCNEATATRATQSQMTVAEEANELNDGSCAGKVLASHLLRPDSVSILQQEEGEEVEELTSDEASAGTICPQMDGSTVIQEEATRDDPASNPMSVYISPASNLESPMEPASSKIDIQSQCSETDILVEVDPLSVKMDCHQVEEIWPSTDELLLVQKESKDESPVGHNAHDVAESDDLEEIVCDYGRFPVDVAQDSRCSQAYYDCLSVFGSYTATPNGSISSSRKYPVHGSPSVMDSLEMRKLESPLQSDSPQLKIFDAPNCDLVIDGVHCDHEPELQESIRTELKTEETPIAGDSDLYRTDGVTETCMPEPGPLLSEPCQPVSTNTKAPIMMSNLLLPGTPKLEIDGAETMIPSPINGGGQIITDVLDSLRAQQSASSLISPTLCASPRLKTKICFQTSVEDSTFIKSCVGRLGQDADAVVHEAIPAANEGRLASMMLKSSNRSPNWLQRSLHAQKSPLSPKDRCWPTLSPTERLAASLHRGVQILEKNTISPSVRRSSGVNFSFQAHERTPKRPTTVDASVQTSPVKLVESTPLPNVPVVSEAPPAKEMGGEEKECDAVETQCVPAIIPDPCRDGTVPISSDCSQWQIVAVQEWPNAATDQKSEPLLGKSVEALLAGAIRREEAADEKVRRQAAEIEQLNRLVRQYKHERECNSILERSREDKIARLENLMVGALPTDAFLNEEWSALNYECQVLQEKYDNHPEVTHSLVEQQRLIEELREYRDFIDLGEKEEMQKEIRQLRKQLQSFLASGPPRVVDSRRRSMMMQSISLRQSMSLHQSMSITTCADSKRFDGSTLSNDLAMVISEELYPDDKKVTVEEAVPEQSSADVNHRTLCVTEADRLEQERREWEERENDWISVLEELRLESDSYRRQAEMRTHELECERRCSEEVREALQMAMAGHARLLDQYAELQEKHISILAKHRKIRDGAVDIKKLAKRAGVSQLESKWLETQSMKLAAMQVEHEEERQAMREEMEGLRAQLRDTADAVQAAGELLVRLKEAEEAVCIAQDAALLAEQDVDALHRELEKVKRKHGTELATFQQRLLEARLQKSSVCQMCVMAERVKYEFTEVDEETAKLEMEAEQRASALDAERNAGAGISSTDHVQQSVDSGDDWDYQSPPRDFDPALDSQYNYMDNYERAWTAQGNYTNEHLEY